MGKRSFYRCWISGRRDLHPMGDIIIWSVPVGDCVRCCPICGNSGRWFLRVAESLQWRSVVVDSGLSAVFVGHII